MVLGVVLRQCSEQMFGTDSVRNSVPSQLSLKGAFKGPLNWDNYKGLPMLELWTARTRSR